MGSPASSWTTAVARSTRRSRSSLDPLVTSKPNVSSMAVETASARRPATQSSAAGRGRRPPRRPLIGFVTLSSDASLVGTMTSGGTDVIEMPSSTARASSVVVTDAVVVVGGSVSADVAIVGMVVVATVAGAVGAVTGGAVEAEGLGAADVESGTPAVLHPARSTTAARTAFDLTSHATTDESSATPRRPGAVPLSAKSRRCLDTAHTAMGSPIRRAASHR